MDSRHMGRRHEGVLSLHRIGQLLLQRVPPDDFPFRKLLTACTCPAPVQANCHTEQNRVVSGFEELVAEGAAVPVGGWDFSWFEGRAIEERPPWGYARMLAGRMAALAGVPGAAALDLQTGGGEVLATI